MVQLVLELILTLIIAVNGKTVTNPKEILSCGLPGSALRSTVTFNTESIRRGTIATYTCETGFRLIGPWRRLCLGNGTWIPKDLPVCLMNAAFGKAAMQSSTVAKGYPENAVDGNEDTCTLTKTETSPFLFVNLLEPFDVQVVAVKFKRTCCENNTSVTFTVRVGYNPHDLRSNPICNTYTGKIEEKHMLYFPCTFRAIGKFVSIHLEAPISTSLSICEIHAYTAEALLIQQCPVFEEEPSTGATYQDKCYFFHSNQPRSLEDATKFCALHGGRIIHHMMLTSVKRGFIMWELYKRHKTNYEYWNGVARDRVSKKWTLLEGKDPFSSWSIPPTGKNCSKFDHDNLLNFESPLETECNRKLNFICEHDPVTCGMPERPANSSIIMGSAVGSDTEYHCQPGHLLQGPTKIACLGTGFFSGATPKCLYIECDFPASIPNGGYTLVNGTKYYQSIVQYFCQESYVLVGQSELMCDADRKWNGSLPRCDPILCHNPPRISHGNARVIVNIGVPYTIAEYTCEAAYTLVGEKRISCDSTGFWTSKPPICLGKKKIKIC